MTDLNTLPAVGRLLLVADTALIAWSAAFGFVHHVVSLLF